MRNKTIIAIIVVILIGNLYAEIPVIPVIDPAELEKNIEIDLMEGIFREVEKLLREVENIKEKENLDKLISTYEGIKDKILNIFTKDDLIEIFENGDIFLGENSKDTWREVWRKLQNIRNFYPELREDYSALYNSELYKYDPLWKKYIDKVIEISKESKKDNDNKIDFYSDLREIGEKRVNKYKNFIKRLKEFSKEGKDGKVLANIGFINLERIRVMNEKHLLKNEEKESFLKRGIRSALLGRVILNEEEDAEE